MGSIPGDTIMSCIHKAGQRAVFAGFIALVTASCSYRFTNKNVIVPHGLRTIAVENIYDTSGEVIPHHILWESLQREFAKDGHLRVVSQGRADALLRAHISDATVRPVGSSFETAPDKDRNVDLDPAPRPEHFRTLPQAGEFTRREQLSFKVNIEIIDLYSKNVVFRKSYDGTREFRTARSEQTVAEKKSHFLLYEEALRTKFTDISNAIASNIVRDFIVGR